MPSHDTRDLKLCSLLIIFSSEKIHHTYFLDFSEKGNAPVLLSAAVFLHMKWHVSCTISCSRMQVTSACRRTGGRAHFPIAPTLLVTHSSSHMSRTLLVTHFECNGGGAGDTVWELVATKSGQSSPKTNGRQETHQKQVLYVASWNSLRSLSASSCRKYAESSSLVRFSWNSWIPFSIFWRSSRRIWCMTWRETETMDE